MTHVVLKLGNQRILYDPALFDQPGPELFEPDTQSGASRITAKIGGRNAVYFLRVGQRDYVLRHYWRGGMAARVSKHGYLWLGAERSRPFREWRLLHRLHQWGLPVPRPAAARVLQRGAIYHGDILTEQLSESRTLAELARERPVPIQLWKGIGRTIRRLHDAGAYHADLNASNVLINAHDQVFVIDWDRGRLRTPSFRWQQQNLMRLARSLEKFSRKEPSFHFAAADWEALENGYRGSE